MYSPELTILTADVSKKLTALLKAFNYRFFEDLLSFRNGIVHEDFLQFQKESPEGNDFEISFRELELHKSVYPEHMRAGNAALPRGTGETL